MRAIALSILTLTFAWINDRAREQNAATAQEYFGHIFLIFLCIDIFLIVFGL